MRRSYIGENNPFFGKYHTEEVKEKNRQEHLGKCGEKAYHWKGGFPKCIICGKILKNRYAKRCLDCYNKNVKTGNKRSLEYRKKMSEMNKGENGSNWKGGISKKNERIRKGIEFRLWREAVFTRDNWTCQRCKIKGGELHPHHIKSFAEYPELRFTIDNGITLCKNCHKETDNYGNGQ